MSVETREALLASLPPGVREMLADDVIALFDATASTIDDSAVAAVDALDADSSPLTCGSDRLRRWESDLGIASTRTALFGTLTARRAAVISRLREYGPPTVAMLQSVLAPLLDYSDPTTLTILETDRAALRAAHVYSGVAVSTYLDMVTAGIWEFYVDDDGRVAPGGVVIDITLSTLLDVSGQTVTVQTPQGNFFAHVGTIGRGVAASATYRLYFPAVTASSVFGTWRVYVYTNGASTGTLEDCKLFVEGMGPSGLCGAAFEWAAVYEPTKSNGSPDFDAAVAASQRVGLATRTGGVVMIADAGVGLADGDYGAIPSDNTKPSGFVPGA